MTLLDGQMKAIETVTNLHCASRCESIKHSVNDGASAPGDDKEFFAIDLSRLPLKTHHLLFAIHYDDSVTTKQKVNSSQLFIPWQQARVQDTSLCLRMVNKEAEDTFSGREMFNYTLETKAGCLTYAGVLSRQGSIWNFKALRVHAIEQPQEQLFKVCFCFLM